MMRRLIDTIVALVALLGLILAVRQVDVPVFFRVAVAAAVILYALCYAAPRLMTRVISAPQAFRVDENYGTKAFEMQVVSYSSYHSAWLADVTHIGFYVEAVAWYVLAYNVGGLPALLALTILKGAQIASYRDVRFGKVLAGIWIAVPVIAGMVSASIGASNVVAMSILILVPAWRVIGHITEPVPPGVSGSGRFVPLEDHGLTASLGLSFVAGYVAEFASGIPFRLADVWAYDIATRAFGYTSTTLLTRSAVNDQRARIYESGWEAAPATSHLVTSDA